MKLAKVIILVVLVVSSLSSVLTVNNEEALWSRNIEDTPLDKEVSSTLPDGLSNINLSVSLDESNGKVSGIMLIDYYCDVPHAIDTIPFHIYPSGMVSETRPGAVEIHSVEAIEQTSIISGIRNLDSQQLFWVDLESDLSTGDSLLLKINFTTTLPDGGSDRASEGGTDEDETRIFTFASAYPIPCVYDKYDGWNTDPYIQVGDPFYFDMAHYDFTVEVPSGMIVAATGELDSVETVDGMSIHHYVLEQPVREVTFSASRYYVHETEEYNGVQVSTFYLPSSSDAWEETSLEQTIQALELFNATFGEYPYSTLNVVEQHAYYGGMEYPCQVYVTYLVSQRVINRETAPWYVELVIAHEVGHQWWSQLVGDDCVDWGFLDEGLTCWSHSYYAEVYYNSWIYFQSAKYIDVVRTFNSDQLVECTINQSNTERPDLTGYVDYTFCPLVLEKLRMTIGHDDFIAGLQHFFEVFSFKIATLGNLQESFESVTGTDLDWFFFPWFDNSFLPVYVVDSAYYDPVLASLSFTIEDLFESFNVYPYSQEVTLQIYDSVDDLLYNELVWINGTTSFTLSLSSTPTQIVLYYGDEVLVQLFDQSQNSYTFENIATSYLTVTVIGLIVGAVSVSIVLLIRWKFKSK